MLFQMFLKKGLPNEDRTKKSNAMNGKLSLLVKQDDLTYLRLKTKIWIN